MAKNSRRTEKRRQVARRNGSGPSRAVELRPLVDALESRQLLSVAINEFGGATPISRPDGITLGSDGNLWFTEFVVGGSIGRTTPSGATELFPLAYAQGGIVPNGITAGPNGNLWFTDSGTGVIGEITTSGTVTAFRGVTATSVPDQITTGTDGALWFTERQGNRIGRVNTLGNFTEFTIPTANTQPQGIASGPDGALWFTESNTSKIGRITTAGAITEYSIGITPKSSPTRITAGPDGNLWFTEQQSSRIGRITPRGVIKEFSNGISSSTTGITAGPDGNLWFTEPNGAFVGKITTQGAVTEFAGIKGTAPTGITAGPDGNLWFTELLGNHVDRIGTAGGITRFPSPTNTLASGSTPFDITTGPDNALYFTANSTRQIGRIDTAGMISTASPSFGNLPPVGITLGPADLTGTRSLWYTIVGSLAPSTTDTIGQLTLPAINQGFLIPSRGSHLPEGITLGPDGNLWFAENGNGSFTAGIGMITPTGTIQEFRSGLTSGASPNWITAGPDGALWFTAKTPGGGEIGRIVPPTLTNPNPLIANFPIFTGPSPTASNPISITLGPDGNLWYADAGHHAIGRITPTLTPVITEFSLGSLAVDDPNGIVAGPDGNLWFTETTGNQIGRITTQGVFDLFAVPTRSAGSLRITLGSDNNLWFVEASANQIGQVVLPQSLVNAIGTSATVPATVSSQFVVATFGDLSLGTNAANFVATIDYGDGTSGPGMVRSAVNSGGIIPGSFEVVGTHTYASPGPFTAHVTIGTPVGSLAPVPATINVTSPLQLTPTSIDGFVGRQANTQVALFTDQDTTSLASNFTAMVNWGDNTSSAANITRLSAGSILTFEVNASHTYLSPGTFVTSVSILDRRNSLAASGSGAARIASPPTFTAINEFTGATPGGGPTAITLGPDGKLWYTDTTGGKIGTINTSGVSTEYPGIIQPSGTGPTLGLTPGSGPAGIVTGPDGALWFAEMFADRIGRITTSGAITEYSTGISPGSMPTGITLGPDGNLWFTEPGIDRIGRITLAGLVTEYSVGIDPGQNPIGITSGPDGNLWFVGLGNSNVGRITPLGFVTEFDGATGSGLSSITTGPDSALWFTESVSSIIGRIDPNTGFVTEFNDPSIVRPTAITLAPDHASLWFTELGDLADFASAPAIAQINTQGQVHQVKTGITPNSRLGGIVAGPDRNLYFAETAGDRIGQAILPQSSVVAAANPNLPIPIAGQSFTAVYATFRDNSPAANLPNFQARIDYGDGTIAAGSVTLGPNGVFSVSGTHTFAKPFTVFHGSVVIFNDAGAAAPVPFTIEASTTMSLQVVNAPDVHATQGQTFTGDVADFIDMFGFRSPGAGSYSAVIDWGDGTASSPGIVAPLTSGGQNEYRVTGSHVYANLGMFHVTTTIQVISDPANSATAVGLATVSPVVPNLTASAGNLYVTRDTPFNGQVASLVDEMGSFSSSGLAATINWGDGVTSQGTVQSQAGITQIFQILGRHTYTRLGSFPLTVSVHATQRPDTASVSVTAFVEVAGPIDEIGGAGSSVMITPGPDGALWSTDPQNNQILRVTTAGVITRFTNGITANAGPLDITTGPDGALWFTESRGAIGRITTQGDVTEFTQGLANHPNLQAITAGSDGALWFTDFGGAIGRITTSGAVTFSTRGLSPNARPGDITAGPDGNLWFTEETLDSSFVHTSRIGRITTAGVITEFTPPSATSRPISITAGPDGALWFTEQESGKIGRITTAGGFTEYAQGLSTDSRPYGIRPGADGNLWFVDAGTNHVDRITPSGVITPFAIPTALSGPVGIAPGSDRNIWFTEPDVGQFGQVVLPESVIPTGLLISAVPGQPTTGPFATFHDRSSLVNLARFFTAAIAFGDGSFGAGTIASDGLGGFVVAAPHTYQRPGRYTATVTITDAVGTSAPAISTVIVAAPRLAFVVTNTNDSGPGSLRQVILNANQVGGHTITFAIPSNGIATITPASPLPFLTGPTFVNATSQATFVGLPFTKPLVEVDGRQAGGSSAGLVFARNSAGSRLAGLSIFGFGGPQVNLESDGDLVQSNYLGLRADGSALEHSGFNFASDGLLIHGARAIVGGVSPIDTNVISGNAGQGIEVSGPGAVSVGIFANIIGLDPTGTVARGNAINGIAILFGANTDYIGPGNLISGNRGDGIALIGVHAILVSGNAIGTDVSVSRAIGNGVNGIEVGFLSQNITIGGITTGSTNFISGNGVTGIEIGGESSLVFVQENLVGTDRTGTASVGNGIAGILIEGALSNVIGPGNLISGNGVVLPGAGIWIDSNAANNRVFGNRIGTNLAGDAAVGNRLIGVLINESAGNTIGGNFAGATNVISGNNLIGVMIAGGTSMANVVQGNLIGTDVLGRKAVGNGSDTQGDGLYVNNAPGNLIGGSGIGMGNLISGNVFDGVQVFGPSATGNLFQGNKIGTDFFGTRAIGNGNDGLVINEAPGTRIVANLVSANGRNGFTISGKGAGGTILQANAIGLGIGGEALGNGSFGILITNQSPEPVLVGNLIARNALGPIRDTNVAPAAANPFGTKPRAKVKVQSLAHSFGTRPMPGLQVRGHAISKASH